MKRHSIVLCPADRPTWMTIGLNRVAWLIRISDGGQLGSGFVDVNPNSQIPALMNRSGPIAIRVFEPGAIG